VKRTLVVLLGLLLFASTIAVAQTAVVPEVIEGYRTFLFFNNETGADAYKLAVNFDQAVMFDEFNIITFGGGWPSMIAITEGFAFIDVYVVAGGTLQLILPEAYTDARVVTAYWFE